MGQEESLLVFTKIKLSNEYKLESETSTSSALSPHISLLLILSLLLQIPTPIPSLILNNLPLSYTMSQHSSINYKQIIQ